MILRMPRIVMSRYYMISLVNGVTFEVEDAEGYRILELLGGE